MARISLNIANQKRDKIEIISEIYQLPFMEGITKKSVVIGRNRVNLYYLTCSCKEYRQNVKLFPRRDIRRICKHLYNKLFSEAENKIDPLTKILLHNKFWFGQTGVKKIKFHDYVLFIGLHKIFNFVSVYRYDNEIWNKYSYDLLRDEWADRHKPFDDDDITKDCTNLIKHLISTIS